ncbi:hypothetical protein L9F63_027466, partial [Diploptera punctata]
PKDLQPFPNRLNTVYEGHTDMVRSIAVEPKGQYLVSGSDDLTVKVWEISTGRCVRTFPLAYCVDDLLICSRTDSMLDEAPKQDFEVPERVKAAVQWEQAEEVKQVTWHGIGDYFATVMPEGQNRSVIIHQLSTRRSQLPFSKPKGLVQCVLFHPIRPFFFVATQKNIRVYDLTKQEMVKKLYSNSKWISSMAIHP